MSTLNDDMLNFHLTGRHGSEKDARQDAVYRPALMAPYARLSELRYDFPVVLLDVADSPAFVDSLTGVIGRLLREIASEGNAGTLLRQQVLRLERRMRAMIPGRSGIALTELWEEAAQSLLGECGEREAEVLGNSLATARFALRIDGPVLDCDDALPARLLRHAWEKVEARRTRPTRERIEALITRLREMIKVDDLKGRASRSPERLRQTFGRRYREAFDFELMAEVLEGATPHNPLPQARRERISDALGVLEAQRFFVPFDGPRDRRYHDFAFDRLSTALRAWHERLQEIAEVVRAIEVAELELDNAFREDRHPAYFERFGAQALTPEDLAMFPAYLVCVHQSECSSRDTARLMEIVAGELPIKALVQVSDALGSASGVDDNPYPGSAMQLPQTFVAGNAYVLQAAASDLYQRSGDVLRGLEYEGPGIFSVFVPGGEAANALPPYLVAAAAMEARVFPAYTYDPAAGAGLAQRFRIDGNPDVADDWPLRELRYQDEALQAVTEDYRFTLADFAVTEPQYAEHFEPVERSAWNDDMLPLAEYLDVIGGRNFEKVPYVAVVDADDRLRRLIVDDHLVRIARRCRDRWHTLQELGGVHNSWAEAARAAVRSESAGVEQAAPAAIDAPADVIAPAGTAVAADAVPSVGTQEEDPTPAEAAEPVDEPWIETPRCTTCDECTTRNPRMFAYDDNKQAYIRDPDAGTFRELVEAAETCQVAIIHPGRPRNADEPGLEELIERAVPFNS